MPPADRSPPFDRPTMLDRLADEHFDVVVVGGGITGVGVALDAAHRGLRTALVEAGDFASGTSSKSSKLVHGGLRYLQQGEVRLVYEALRERQRLMRNAPHLVSLMPFMIPILTRDGVISRKIARALGSALWMYDLTGGARIGKLHRRLSKRSARAHFPTARAARLAGGYLYYDAAADDARLCLTIARTAAAHGAAVANRCRVIAVDHDEEGRACGVIVDAADLGADDPLGAPPRRLRIRADAVVNAAGVWSDEVRALDERADPDTIRPAKGVHVTVPWHKIRNDIAVIIPVPKDRRSLFLIPWGARPDGTFEHTYVGTTDTDYRGPLDDPQCTAQDIDYVIRALDAALDPDVSRVTADDVTGTWAGLRPLVKGVDAPDGDLSAREAKAAARTADLSRRHLVHRSPHGVITVTGGKLTTYRQMAQDAVDAVEAGRGTPRRPWRRGTARLRLLGAANGRPRATPGSFEHHLHSRHGSMAAEVAALVQQRPEWGEPLVDGLAYLRAEAVYSARYEMALTLEDVLDRRTRARLLDRAATVRAAPAVAQLLAVELGWTAERTRAEVEAYVASCRREADAAVTGDGFPGAIPGAAGQHLTEI